MELSIPSFPVPSAKRARVASILLVALGLTAGTGVGTGLSAQTVTGTVREAGSGRALSDALVALVDPSGVRIAATVTRPNGSFVLDSRAGGIFRLQTRLLGYQEVISEPFELAIEGTIQRDVVASVRAVPLAGIEATTSKSCRSLSAAGPELAAVWDEAKTALEIVAWTAETEALVYDVVEYARFLDTSTLEVREAAEESKRNAYVGSPYVSVSADTLQKHGYVRRSTDGSQAWEYWAPDADVLLSDTFLETHCFDFDANSDGERLGVRFEPIAGRDLPEIEGVFWLDRSTSELRSLEFRYVGLPTDHPESPHTGGEVAFQHLATGLWIVDEWRIRIPNVVLRLRPAGVRRVVESIYERGARVLRAQTVSGETLADAMGATLAGTVLTEVDGLPLRDAVLEVVSTGSQTTVGSDGSYLMTRLPPGTFQVRVSHPWLRTLGLEPIRRTALLEEGAATRLRFDVDLAGPLGRFCPGVPDARVLYGTIRDPSSDQPVGRAVVRVEAGKAVASDLSTPSGEWAVCVDAGIDSVSIALVSPSGEERVRTATRVDDDPLVEVLLEASASDFTDQVRPPEGEEPEPTETILRGVLFQEGSQIPVEGALVVLRSADGTPLAQTESGRDGKFTLTTASSAYSYLTVQKTGYLDKTLMGDLGPAMDSSEGIRVYLAPQRSSSAELW